MIENTKEYPLISVVLVTYNSQDYVMEALNSIKEQTYPNIELIITDDCSSDETVSYCKKWLLENNICFTRANLLVNEKNKGTAINLNNGIRYAEGEWIKSVAGDDALCPEYLMEMYNYFTFNNTKALVISSNVIKYNSIFCANRIIHTSDCIYIRFFAYNTSALQQYKILLRFNPVYAASTIIHKTVFKRIGLYDENYPLYEDRPYWVRVTYLGIKIDFCDVAATKYRISASSVQKKENSLFFTTYDLNVNTAIRELFISNYPFFERQLKSFMLKNDYTLFQLFNNKNNHFIRFVRFIIQVIPKYILKIIQVKYYLYITSNSRYNLFRYFYNVKK